MGVRSIFYGLIAGVILCMAAEAKDCDCKQHKAGASGTGSCSLTEDSSRCSIKYSATSSSKDAQAVARTVLDGFKPDLNPQEAFSLFNRSGVARFEPNEKQFRGLIINIVAF